MDAQRTIAPGRPFWVPLEPINRYKVYVRVISGLLFPLHVTARARGWMSSMCVNRKVRTSMNIHKYPSHSPTSIISNDFAPYRSFTCLSLWLHTSYPCYFDGPSFNCPLPFRNAPLEPINRYKVYVRMISGLLFPLHVTARAPACLCKTDVQIEKYKRPGTYTSIHLTLRRLLFPMISPPCKRFTCLSLWLHTSYPCYFDVRSSVHIPSILGMPL